MLIKKSVIMKLIPEELKPPKISTFQFVGFNIISEDFFTCKNRFVCTRSKTLLLCVIAGIEIAVGCRLKPVQRII